MVNYLEAVRALLQVGDVHFGWTEGPLSEITLKEGVVPPTEDAIQAKLAELQAAEPIRLLRERRDWLLAETDWMANKDVTLTTAWKNYRQALRDLPAIAEPQLDENGQLTNITWPEKPEK